MKIQRFLIFFVLLCNTGYAQIYKFQQYGLNKGLCHYTVYSIAQDKHGFIWFSTGLGLCKYDGNLFTPPPPSSGLPATNVNTSFRDDKGNLWFGYNDGLVVKYDGYSFSVVDSAFSNVTQIIQASNGDILVTTKTGGITRIGKKIERLGGLEESFINAVCFANDNQLLVGAQDGLYLYHYGNEVQKLTLIANDENLSYTNVTSLYPKADGKGYWVTTEDEGVFYVRVHENRISSLHLDIPKLDEAKAQSVQEDTQGNLWISTFGMGLVRVQLSTDMDVLKTSIYNSSNGLDDHVKMSLFDKQQNLWVATYTQGVACNPNMAFSFFETETLNPIKTDGAINATAVYSVDDSEYWIAGKGVIIRKTNKPEPKTTVWRNSDGLPNDKITFLRTDDAGNLWIGTGSSGLFKLANDTKKITRFYNEENSLSNTIQSFIFENEQIWMATLNGVLTIDMKTAKKIKEYSINTTDLPHNNIRDIFKDSQGRIWVATKSNSLIDIKNTKRLTLPDHVETEFSSITEDEKKRIWAGTADSNGRGVFLFEETTTPDSLSVTQFTDKNDLKSNYCYAITSDGNGRIWVGHRVGLSSININSKRVNTYGKDNSIYGDVNPLAMNMNKNGEMLIGMTDGVMLYDSKTEQPHEIIPMLNLTKVMINDSSYNTQKPLVLPYKRGGYKVEFNFVGLQYSNPLIVTYQHLWQRNDEKMDWTPFSKTSTASFLRVEDGDYSFWVRACNGDNCTDQTMLFSLKVNNPFWLTWWFILSVIVVVIGLGYVLISASERRLRKQQEYLEKELKARTKEVHKQKEEIEMKNRDITDSINYAQRIQFSVLPSTSTLLEHCSGAFIFYRPRDIVSGDFYWFDYFPNFNRLLIVCADSTGHGVPGAFMSLIGTTLIKDIAMRPDVLDPADILYRLDENIQSTLNQNRDSEHANDGMDIVVCEINTITLHAKIASAMRPYIIYHEGVPTTYKSSRSSIGGQNLENKVFETTEVQLSKGDIIYMFTDGYTDQFGGPSGKKLKMTRLQNILNDIHNRDMDEQYRVIRDNFDLWKGSDKQVDDVLMIGVRI